MKNLILIFSLFLNIIFILFTLKSCAISNKNEDLKETLYLLDLANVILNSPSTRFNAKNPYFFNLKSADDGKIYFFDLNPNIEVISHSADYGFYLEIDENENVKHLGWYKP